VSRKIFIGKKNLQYYNNLLIKADLNLHQQIANEIQKNLPRGSKILDFGCGEGALSQRLVDLGYEVVGVDINLKDFKANNVKFIQIDLNNAVQVNNFLNNYYEQFDCVLGVETIEHLYDPWSYIDNLAKALKKGGLLIVTTPNITSWLSRIIFLFTGRFHQFGDDDVKYGHIAPLTAWELELILRSKNFTNITIKPAGTLPPIYITGINKLLFINVLALLLRPFMKGIKDGWCILSLARKVL
jgi:2-polyprenyl-3-methyl-5-hydroxy-6-metoxy-1,4-benzoquinol methylase